MATHTIGTGGDFSTLQAWEDDIPATLTEQRIGQCKDQEHTNAPGINFSAHTTTASFNIILEAEAGAGVNDRDRSAKLQFDTSGARITANAAFFEPIRISGSIGHLIIRNLMIQKPSGEGVGCIVANAVDCTSWLLKDLICESLATGTYNVIDCRHNSGTLRLDNVVVIHRGSSGGGVLAGRLGDAVINGCTIVRPSNITPTGTGLSFDLSGTYKVFSTVIAGFSTDCNVGWDSTSDYNATTFSDAASGLPDPATDHNVYSITYDTALFVQPSDASGLHDFRTLAASALENAGLLDATNAPNDISGEPRNDPPEIGAWELTPPPPTMEPRFLNPLQSNLSWR